MIAILINAIVIFISYFPEYRNNQWLFVIDELFVVFFAIEAIVKIAILKPRQYFSFAWNRFDFLIVMGSLPSLLNHFISIPDTSLLVVLRLFRIIRLIRFIRFIPHMDKIILGLGRAIKSSVFILLALLLINILIAIFTCHLYGEMVPEYFGNPLISCYSIFQMFTVEGWNEIPTAIAAKMENPIGIGLTRFYFVLVVLIGGIFGMSLANAVFVDEMTADNNQDVEAKLDALQHQISELKQLIEQQGKNNN